ncbi:MAG: diacylglycerol kinase family lipid kinase [Planctomycetes bacterium]|nr:diacylglycerol kinase family lipid kinase [Planctomycetota bacterium]
MLATPLRSGNGPIVFTPFACRISLRETAPEQRHCYALAPMRRLALVVNPVSGRGRARKAATLAAELLGAAGIETVIHETRRAGDGRDSVRALAEGMDGVIAVGGDGTLGEVVAGLAGLDISVGVIPVGTANVVARELSIPLSPKRAVQVLVAGRTREVDLGRANGRPFLAMVGVGLDGAIVAALSRVRTGPISMLSYIRPSLGAARAYAWPQLQVEIDGVALKQPCYGLLACNTANYGGIFHLVPGASCSDGQLDLHIWTKPGMVPALRRFGAGLLRLRSSSGITHYAKARHIRVSAMNGAAVDAQIDGDILGTTPVEITLEAGKARLFAP